ncbi:HAMP domain-containing protein [Heliobacterium gestii]|uniref:HAMP domain-containing protein n=1 Tax=Heliomicrobium gestii TaxID=2699 RepID=A0A845LG94_HELGE|nr:methyl-accepting chemotaxis protein [Heliomicrobium gestii]MBM7866171.1 methyl-accepting chemotaxis protein [Heliomicrobium gestii]MZP42503.1 HAMP domain-containing protein [Heliomicrobium gestii]
MRLTTKLMAFFVLFALLPSLLLGTGAFVKARSSIEDQIRREQNFWATDVVNSLDDRIRERINLLNALAKQPDLTGMDPARQKAVLVENSKVFSDMDALVVIDAAGMQTVRSNEAQRVNVADRDYFQGILGGKDAVIGTPVVSKSTGGAIMGLSVPIRQEGRTVGVLAGYVRLDKVVQHYLAGLKQVDPHAENKVIIAGGNGKLLYHPDPEIMTKDQVVELPAKTGDFRYHENGIEYLATINQSELSGWTILIREESQVAFAEVQRLLILIAGMAAVTVLLALSMATVLSRRIIHPLRHLGEQASRMAEGELNVAVNGKEKFELEIRDLAEAFEQMVGKLRSLIGDMLQSAEQLNRETSQLDSSCRQTAQAAEELARTNEQLAAGVSSRSSGVVEIARRIDSLAQLADSIATEGGAAEAEGKRIAELSRSVVDDVQVALDHAQELAGAMSDGTKTVRSLEEKSHSIEVISQAITGIAEQTNLLALNAAIEASRAGEQGRGFAVVAGEIRKLAEESRKSAEEIQRMLDDVRQDVQATVAVMATGMTMAGQEESHARSNLERITAMAQLLQDQLGRLEQVIDEARTQSKDADEAARAINALSQQAHAASSHSQSVTAIAQEVAASSEQVAQTAAQLSDLADASRMRAERFILE